MTISEYEGEDDGIDSYVFLNIPISSRLEPSIEGLKYMYVYDSSKQSLEVENAAATTIIAKLGEDGLFQDENGDYRYKGSDPANYAKFNCDNSGNNCEIWRIIGIFDGKIKLIRNESLGNYAWDSTEGEVNYGSGINEWSQSDLMQELNGDYLKYNLSENTLWYNGRFNQQDGTFDHTKVLKQNAQELIANSLWNIGGSAYNVSLTQQYANERGTRTCQASGVIGCVYDDESDEVLRTTSWRGLVGLMYPSDYGYASANQNCKNNLGGDNQNNCKNQNWLFNGTNQWTITPHYSNANIAQIVYSGGSIAGSNAYNIIYADSVHIAAELGQVSVRPVVYLKSTVKLTSSSGDGSSSSNAYVFEL